MEALINFYEQPDPFRLADAIASIYSIPRDHIALVVRKQVYPSSTEKALAFISLDPETQVEATVLETGEAFAKTTGVRTELELAADLCQSLGTNAVFSGDGLPIDHWILVTAEGSHGEVVVDPDESDEGRIKIVGLREPIAGITGVPLV